MPNPRPGFHTTGTLETREELQRTVRALRNLDFDWTAIGRELGISPRTAKRVHEEAEAAIKAARDAAYAAAGIVEHEAEVVAAQTGLKPATVIYIGLIIIALIAFFLIR